MLYSNHSRSFKENRYVYPVLSRRSKGISIGINLNPDKVCNFDCIYCQVDREVHPQETCVDIPRLLVELRDALDLVRTGRIFSMPPFDNTPPSLQHLSDIAVSGDGEPTTFTHFYEVIKDIIHMKNSVSDNIKLVLISNSTGFNRAKVREALDLMYENNGEAWAKLDAGNEMYYKKVSRSNIPFEDIIRNITITARKHPLVIQSCFNKISNLPPSMSEIEVYVNAIKKIKEEGGSVRLVQIYTVARQPAEGCVTPLSEAELTLISAKVKEKTGITSEAYL